MCPVLLYWRVGLALATGVWGWPLLGWEQTAVIGWSGRRGVKARASSPVCGLSVSVCSNVVRWKRTPLPTLSRRALARPDLDGLYPFRRGPIK